jgi:peptide/nickel transport system substrate-binding protein
MEPPDSLSGGKVVKLDELVPKTMPGDATGANALSAGNIGYMHYLLFDFLAPLRRNREVRPMGLKGIDMFQGNFRLNHASGPFADPAVRQVMWKLVDQKQVLDAIGIPAGFRLENYPSFWMYDTPFQRAAGSKAVRSDMEGAKAALARPEGWGPFPVGANGVDVIPPLNPFYIANNCSDYPGRSCDDLITTLLQDLVRAPDAAARKSVAEIQRAAYELVPSVTRGNSRGRRATARG